MAGYGLSPTYAWLAVAIGAVVLMSKLLRVGMRPKGYPPGPPTLPIIGNLHQLPLKDLHLQFQKWSEQCNVPPILYKSFPSAKGCLQDGPVVSIQLGTQTLVLLGDATGVSDLLEKKGSIYSTRMDIMFREFGNELNIAFRPYDDIWRRQRKVYHVRLNAKLANNYLPYQYFETFHLLHDLLESPGEFRHHVERFTISIGSTIAFGKRVPSADEPAVKTLMEWFHGSIQAGSSLQIADWWPIIRPLIRAVPLAINPIKKALITLHLKEENLWKRLVGDAREHVKHGRFYPSLCRDMITRSRESEKDHLSEEEIWYNSGHAWAAATDTQSNTLLGFIKAMTLYPDVQYEARNEIDRVIGSQRLPDWTDRANLPYVRRCVDETLRWAPTALTGGPMPHATSKPDIYKGFYIPAGAGVVNCVWTINNDPVRFNNPRKFNPLRFSEEDSAMEGFSITQNYEKRPHNTFGAGRRICPGSHVAERTLFVTMARLLWAFEFYPKIDKFGKAVPINRDGMTEGMIVGPEPFECDIRPRGDDKVKFIRSLYEEANTSLDTEGNYTQEFFKENWKASEMNEK